ncbi:MAG TPA: hypothetical protein VII92_02565 [Anaerolineae bacterium]
MSEYEESEIEASFDYCGNFMNVDKARAELASLRSAAAERDKWRAWHPDDETLAALQKQAKARDGSYMNSLAANAAYIGALEGRLRALVSERDELIGKLDRTCARENELRFDLQDAHNERDALQEQVRTARELLTTLEYAALDNRVNTWLAANAQTPEVEHTP